MRASQRCDVCFIACIIYIIMLRSVRSSFFKQRLDLCASLGSVFIHEHVMM